MSKPLDALEAAIGHEFRDQSLVRRALTHRSARREHNERLEFLGDALLGFLVAEQAWNAHPDADEGDLTIMRSAVVKGSTLTRVGRNLELGDFLELGSGEAGSGGRERDSILAAAVEALLAAIYLDGGMEACREFVRRWIPEPGADYASSGVRKDNKTRLQELIQSERRALPDYELLGIRGKGHQQRFEVRCLLPGHRIVTEGSGPSRRAAEQAAAGKALAALGQEE